MLKIIMNTVKKDTIDVDDVNQDSLIYAEKNGKPFGVVVLRCAHKVEWSLMVGMNVRFNAYKDTLEELLKANSDLTFHVLDSNGE